MRARRIDGLHGRDGAQRSPLLYVFLLAPVFYLLALIGFPILYNIAMSFQEVTLRNLGQLAAALRRRWIISAKSLRIPTFRKVFVNSLVFVSANVVGQVDRWGFWPRCSSRADFPGAHFLRGLLLATWMLPGLVVGALWKWMFASQYGVVNFVLRGPASDLQGRCIGCRIPPSP